MTATAEQIQIGSAASVIAGDKPLTDFTGSATGELLGEIYEIIARGELGERRYKWAQRQQQLSREVAVPNTAWEASYLVPSDVIELLTVFDGPSGQPITYERYESHLFCNATANDVLVAKYIFRADESQWPYQFRVGMVLLLAGYIADGVQEDEDKAEKFWDRAEKKFMRAGHHSAQGSTSRKIARSGRLVSARLGGR